MFKKFLIFILSIAVSFGLLPVQGQAVAAEPIQVSLNLKTFKSFKNARCSVATKVVNFSYDDSSQELVGEMPKYRLDCGSYGSYEVQTYLDWVSYTDDTHANYTLDLSKFYLGKLSGSMTWNAEFAVDCAPENEKIKLEYSYYSGNLFLPLITSEVSATLVNDHTRKFSGYAILNASVQATAKNANCEISGSTDAPKALKRGKFVKLNIVKNLAKLNLTPVLSEAQLAADCRLARAANQSYSPGQTAIFVEVGSSDSEEKNLWFELECQKPAAGLKSLQLSKWVSSGETKNLQLKFSRNLISVGGQVTFSYPECKLASLLFSSVSGWVGNSEEVEIAADGTYSVELVPAKYSIEIVQNQASYEAELEIAKCQLDLQPQQLSSNRSDLNLNAENGEITFTVQNDSNCQAIAPSYSRFRKVGNYDVATTVTCESQMSSEYGSVLTYGTKLIKSVTVVAGQKSETPLSVATPQIRELSGTINLPALRFSSSVADNMQVYLFPKVAEDESYQGWYWASDYFSMPIIAEVTKVNSTTFSYRAEVPDGNYRALVGLNEEPSNGCLLETDYEAQAESQSFTVDGETQAMPTVSFKSGYTLRGITKPKSWLYLKLTSQGTEPTVVQIQTDSRGRFVTDRCLPLTTTEVRGSLDGQHFDVAGITFTPTGSSYSLSGRLAVDETETPGEVQVPYFSSKDGIFIGTLQDINALPLANHGVFATCQDGSVAFSQSDSEGRFEVSGLGISECQLLVMPPGSDYAVESSNYGLLTGGTIENHTLLPSRWQETDLGVITVNFESHSALVLNDFFEANQSAQSSSVLANFGSVLAALSESSAMIAKQITTSELGGLTATPETYLAEGYYDTYVFSDSDFGVKSSAQAWAGKSLVKDGEITWAQGITLGSDLTYLELRRGNNSVVYLANKNQLNPIKLADPSLSGTTKVGSTIRSTSGLWVDSVSITNSAISYQWYRCSSRVAMGSYSPATNCTAIPNASKASYKLTKKDKGKFLMVAITATSGNLVTTYFGKSTSKVR